MLFLAGSIVLTAYLTLAFKVLQRLGLDAFQAIVFNYITCVITGSIVNGSFPVDAEAIGSGWFGWSCLLGCMFITLFNLVAITTQRINVAVATVAYKVSLIIPFIFSVYLYNQAVKQKQWLGIIAAFVGVILTFVPNEQTARRNLAHKFFLYLLPAVLFIGSGLQDTIIQYVERTYLNDTNKNASLVTSFTAAALIGIIVLTIQTAQGKQVISTKSILAGVLIGIPNYFSIWCLIQFLKQSPYTASAGIPLNNLGIVLLSTMAAYLFFKEKLSLINWLGIALSAMAIFVIAFGSRL